MESEKSKATIPFKDIFWCEKNKHLFDYFQYQLPKMEMLEKCPICHEPLSYMGEVWMDFDGVWRSTLRLKLLSEYKMLKEEYDPQTNSYLTVIQPRRWEVWYADEIGEAKVYD